MARIAGINIPDRQHTEIGLTARSTNACGMSCFPFHLPLSRISMPNFSMSRGRRKSSAPPNV